MKRLISLSMLNLLVGSSMAVIPGFIVDQIPAAVDSLSITSQEVDPRTGDSMRVDSLAVDVSSADSLAQEATPAENLASKNEITPLDEMREVENRAFGLGEMLVFEISYGPIKAGTAVMKVEEIVQFNGRDCYHVISTAKSNKFFSSFFRVEDRAESFIDVKGIFSWKFEKHLREGKYRADRFAEYDQVRHTVTTNKGQMEVPPYVQDVLSALYYVRTQELVVGQPLFVDNHSGRKLYPLEVKVHRRERVTVPAGTFDCFVTEPILKAGGVFKHKGRLWVWLTADEKRMPVLMKSKVIIGSIDAKLKSYRLGRTS